MPSSSGGGSGSNSGKLPWHIPTRGERNHSTTPSVLHKLCDYVVLAEFDIDTGSTVRHQYPSPIPEYKPDWLAENMLPEGVHNRDKDYTYIFLNRRCKQIDEKYWISPYDFSTSSSGSVSTPTATATATVDTSVASTSSKDDDYFLYGINFVCTKHDETVRRGAVVKAIAIFTRYHYVDIFKKAIELTLQHYYETPSISILSQLYDAINAIDVSLFPCPTSLDRSIMRRGVTAAAIGQSIHHHMPQSWHYEFPIDLSFNINECTKQPKYVITSSIPLYNSTDEIGDISVRNLVKIFGPSTMKIYNALLGNQRILFVGYNHSANDVCQIVLSAVALVSSVIPNVIRRCYPYANLTDLSFLECPGYISGVTNPMFQSRHQWWDLLCILDLPNSTGTVHTSEEKRAEETGKPHGIASSPTSGPITRRKSSSNAGINSNNNDVSSSSSTGHNTADSIILENSESYQSEERRIDDRFLDALVSGIQANLSDYWVRQRFHDYTYNIVYQAQDGNNTGSLSSNDTFRKEYEANSYRAGVLKKSIGFASIPQHPWIWNVYSSSNTCISSSATTTSSTNGDDVIDGMALKCCVRRLQFESSSIDSIVEAPTIYIELSKCTSSEYNLLGLLSLLPESLGGIHVIAVGLLHINPYVKLMTLEILQAIRRYTSTACAFDSLNQLMVSAYTRVLEKLDEGTLKWDADEYRKKYTEEKLRRRNSVSDSIRSLSSSHKESVEISVHDVQLIP